MRLSTKVYVVAAITLFVGGATTAVALMPDRPKEVSFKQSSTVTHPKTTTDAADTPESVPVEQTVTAPPTKPQPTVVAVEPVQSLKDQVAQRIRQRAIENGVSNVDKQVYCVDYVINKNGGYTQENVDGVYAGYINLATPEHPSAYARYDDLCHMYYENVGTV